MSNAHRKAYNSLEEIAREKAGVFSGLASGGATVICRDTECFEVFYEEAKKVTDNLITYGKSADSDWRLQRYDPLTGWLRVSVRGTEIDVCLPAAGEHIAVNVVGAIAAASHLYENWAPAIAGLAGWSPLDGRGRVHNVILPDGPEVRIFDESFNAAPGAVIAVLKALADRPSAGRRVVVLGDMLELGAVSMDCHTEVLSLLNNCNVDMAFFVGDEYRKALQACELRKPYVWYEAADGVLPDLRAFVQDGDEVTVKGAHASGVHSIVREMRRISVQPDH
ncbi:hypothetical protein HOY34_16095 [Xinfangfangia sp. D13-10-4-6]|nr:hypothetical protein [Pseudogemmobacter hezensis]